MLLPRSNCKCAYQRRCNIDIQMWCFWRLTFRRALTKTGALLMRIENWRRAKNTHNLLACEEGNYVYCSKVFVDSICNRFGIDIQLANVEQAVGEVFMTRRVFQAFEPILGPARTAFLAGILVTEFANRRSTDFSTSLRQVLERYFGLFLVKIGGKESFICRALLESKDKPEGGVMWLLSNGRVWKSGLLCVCGAGGENGAFVTLRLFGGGCCGCSYDNALGLKSAHLCGFQRRMK